jgi:hypothetical protein
MQAFIVSTQLMALKLDFKLWEDGNSEVAFIKCYLTQTTKLANPSRLNFLNYC